MSKYAKFLVALLTAVVEGVALWADAPVWVVSVAGFAGAALVWLVRNTPTEPAAVAAVRDREVNY